jgi:hypothetical protein
MEIGKPEEEVTIIPKEIPMPSQMPAIPSPTPELVPSP